MQKTTGARAVAAAVAMMAVGLFAAVTNYGAMEYLAEYVKQSDLVSAQGELVRGVAARVGVARRIGYFSDVPTSDARGEQAFSTVRYLVAPKLLVEGGTQPEPEYWIGNFSKKTNAAEEGTKKGLQIVEDFGNGVVLYRKGAR